MHTAVEITKLLLWYELLEVRQHEVFVTIFIPL
jgi:hypothetical protein